MRRFTFDLGDSNSGPVGFTAAVWAPSAERAVELLRQHLPASHPADDYLDGDDRSSGAEQGEGVEFIAAYFNEEHVRVEDAEEDE